MGNEINQSQIDSSIEDEHIIFPGYSNNLSQQEDCLKKFKIDRRKMVFFIFLNFYKS